MPFGFTLSPRLCILLIVAMTLAVFVKVATFDFVRIDDTTYVTENPVVQSGLTYSGIRWAFSTMRGEHYHPFVWLSLMADAQFFGEWAGGYHLTNLALHIASSILLFLIWLQLTQEIGKSFLLAALFAIHPAHVESVAWVTERKDCLSTLLAMVTIYLYLQQVRTQTLKSRLGTSVFFVICLLCKAMFVTLPVLLCLIEYWPLNRLRPSLVATSRGQAQSLHLKNVNGHNLIEKFRLAMRVILDKWELFAIAGLFAVVAYVAQGPNHSVNAVLQLSFASRAANAIVSCISYIATTMVPIRLCVFYPYSTSILTFAHVAGSLLALFAISAACFSTRRRQPWLIVGWIWFLIGLAPVLGFVRISDFHMADRYLYTSMIGLLVMAIWGGDTLLRSYVSKVGSLRFVSPAVCLSVLTTAAIFSYVQCDTWANSMSLFSHAISVTSENYVGYAGISEWQYNSGRIKESTEACRRCLAINPQCIDVRMRLAFCLVRVGDTEGAIGELDKISDTFRGDGGPRLLASLQLAKATRLMSISEVGEAVQVLNSSAAMLNRISGDKSNLLAISQNIHGVIYRSQRRWKQAIDCFNEARGLDPKLDEATSNLVACCLDVGNRSATGGDLATAVHYYQCAVDTCPTSIPARYNLALSQARLGQVDDSMSQFTAILSLDDAFGPAHLGLAQLYDFRGDRLNAERHMARYRLVQGLRENLGTGRFETQAAALDNEDSISR